MKTSIETTLDKKVLDSIIRRMETLDNWEGVAGFDNSIHPTHGEALVDMMIMNEYGGYDPTINAEIPSRPALRTAGPLSANSIEKKAITLWGQFIKSEIKVPTFYKQLAEEEAIWIADIIRTNTFTPNAPLTLAYKSGTQPLVDTGYTADHVMSKAQKKENISVEL